MNQKKIEKVYGKKIDKNWQNLQEKFWVVSLNLENSTNEVVDLFLDFYFVVNKTNPRKMNNKNNFFS